MIKYLVTGELVTLVSLYAAGDEGVVGLVTMEGRARPITAAVTMVLAWPVLAAGFLFGFIREMTEWLRR